MTVGGYSSIFLHRSLLTLSHLRNFTLQALRLSSVRGFSWTEAWILRPIADPPTLQCRRFLNLAGPEVAGPGRSEGPSACSVFCPPRFLSLAELEVPRPGRVSCYPRTREGRRFLPFFACGPSPESQSLHTLSTTRRVVNISTFQGPPHAFARRLPG